MGRGRRTRVVRSGTFDCKAGRVLEYLLNILFLLLLIPGPPLIAVPLIIRWRTRTPRRAEGQCGSCGYTLHGLPPGGSCPECGTLPGPAMRPRQGFVQPLLAIAVPALAFLAALIVALVPTSAPVHLAPIICGVALVPVAGALLLVAWRISILRMAVMAGAAAAAATIPALVVLYKDVDRTWIYILDGEPQATVLGTIVALSVAGWGLAAGAIVGYGIDRWWEWVRRE